jgi:DNA repair protein SbcD/Mre11
MVTFLHAADIHLDSPLCGLERYEGAPVDRIRSGTRRALERLVDLALERRVDFVLIAGDLYDGDWRDYNTGLFLLRTLGRLGEAGIPTYVITGNHDAANRMTRSLRLPDGVRMLSTDRPETVRVAGLDVAIHGQGFATAAVTQDLSAAYPAPVSGCLNIGMLHTCVAGVEGHQRYAPCTVAGLRAKGYDYWALGHVHHRQVLHDDPPIVFPGNLQGRHARETGPKGCLIVEAEPGRAARSEFHRLDVLRWEVCELDASGWDHPDDLIDRAADGLRQLLGAEDDAGRLLAVRICVVGRTRCHDRFLAEGVRWVNEVRAQGLAVGDNRLWVERVKVATLPPARAADAGSDGPIDVLMDLIDAYRDDEQKLLELGERLADLRRKLPPELMAGDDAPPFGDPVWLRSVLDGAGPLLLHRLRAASAPR